ncbi:MAG: 3-phosphoshikimate 1-carboxyvinyltransferase, partial [Thermoprotei archaeon]
MDVLFLPSVLHGTVAAPASKSLAQRFTVCALFASGETLLENYTACDDTERALDAFRELGGEYSIESD